MKDTNSEVGLGCAAVLLAAPLTAMWRGFVTCILWSWFIVPQFDVRPLTIPMAIGLALFVGFLCNQSTSETKDDERSFSAKIIEALAKGFGAPALCLLLGYIVHLFA